MKQPIRRRAGASVLAATSILTAGTAIAQSYSEMSCGQLWYERNAIFAQYGFCFKTEQAIATFGRACFPPYGSLPPLARERVNEIQFWERRRGCS
jgi:hypothetical protein